MTMTPKLELKGISKRFGDKVVLDGLDLAVEAGRSLVIIGGSGQGKSVTLKIAIGLVHPDRGKILVDGRDVTAQAARGDATHAARFGMLFQLSALFDSLNVWENVAFRLINADRMPRKAAKARALEALERVRLGPDTAELYPVELSGGMQKRVGLARAIVSTPDILFFDEPTTGLDPITGHVIDALIVEQVRRLGCTAVSITHDLASARRIADDIAMIHNGRIVWRGPAAELDRSGNPYVQQFVSGSTQGPISGDR
jgi:phospholipid/cholesterol/gamma-HCH transport system ATP-binding protein